MKYIINVGMLISIKALKKRGKNGNIFSFLRKIMRIMAYASSYSARPPNKMDNQSKIVYP
jgi:hypothetical protein